jgi:Domain of unknown function (DUF4340)
MNNRSLLITFLIILSVLLMGRVLRGKKSSSYDPQIVALDTAKVDRIQFVSGGPASEEFELKRNGLEWEAIQGEMKVKVENANLKSILSPLADLKAKRMVSKDASKYGEYEITDDQAGSVVVWEGKKQVADLRLGGFRFDQAARTASSFVRKGDKPEVYLIDGFVSFGLKTRFDQFRDKKLVKVAAEDLSSIEWRDNSTRKEVIQEEDGLWHYAGMEAVDSTAFNEYLTGLVNSQGSTFSKLTSTQGLTLAEKLTLYGNNMLEPTVISAYASQDTSSVFLIQSSANPEAIFTSDSTGLYKRIFADLRQFWPHGQ